MSYPDTRTVRFTMDIEGTGREDIEFDIVEGRIKTCFFQGRDLRALATDSAFFWAIVELVGGEMAILSKEGDPSIDDFNAFKQSIAL